MEEPEAWKDVLDYEGLYQVSDLGRVRSLARTVLRSNGAPQAVRGRVLRCGKVKAGYLVVVLCRQGHEVTRNVHELVIEAFRGRRVGRQQCRHLNGIPSDARLKNLAWGSPVENQADRLTHGTDNRGTRNGMSKLTEEMVKEIRSLGLTGELSLREIGCKFGVGTSAVWGILHGKKWSY